MCSRIAPLIKKDKKTEKIVSGAGGSKERGRGESKFVEKRKKRKTVFSVTPVAGLIDSSWINSTLLLLSLLLTLSL